MTVSDESDEQLARHWQGIVTTVARVQQLIDAELEAADVPPQWYPPLALLLRAPEHRLPMSTLARELTMTSGGFSKLADRMAADGLIDRRGTVDDRRVVHATLTEQGLALAHKASETYAAALRRRLLGVADAADMKTVAATLEALAAEHGDESTDVSEEVIRERDPALPDRRGRGRTSGSSPSH